MEARADIAAPIPRISLTPEEAATSTGFSRTRIFGAIRAGTLIARGDGKATVIETDELARWVRAMPAKGTAAQGAGR
jgi:hypothetical protein